MLVLSRHVGERIVIGDDVTVTVVGVDRGQVRLAVEAPREVPIDRAEVRRAREEARRAAGAAAPRAAP